MRESRLDRELKSISQWRQNVPKSNKDQEENDIICLSNKWQLNRNIIIFPKIYKYLLLLTNTNFSIFSLGLPGRYKISVLYFLLVPVYAGKNLELS